MMTSPTRRTATVTALALSAGLLLGACSDDDDTQASTDTAPAGEQGTAPESGGDTDLVAACESYLGLTAAFASEPEGDPAVFFEETVAPLAATLEANKPAEIEAELTTILAAVEQAGTGDMSAFESPDFAAAQSEADPFVFETCEFDDKLEVTAADFSFEGIPEEMTSGEVAILMTNEGAEAHEIGIARRVDGVTEEWDELLELPEEEAASKVEFMGHGWTPRTGDQGLMVVDLTPGDYIAICFVPVGTSMDAEGNMTEGTGLPHAMEGMRQEFTVS